MRQRHLNSIARGFVDSLAPQLAPKGPPGRRSGLIHRSPVARYGARARWALLTAVAVSGCNCSREDHPYTPFGITTSGPTADTSGPAASVTSAAPSFEPVTATAITPPSTTFAGSGHNLQAPPGLAFASVLPARVGAEAQALLVAWLVPIGAPGAAAPGLWSFADGPTPRELMKLPGFVPTGPDCTHHVELRQTGPVTVSLDVAARCKTPGIPRAPNRSLVVLDPRSARQLLQLRLADAPATESVTVTVDSTDRDADGHDDVRVDLSLQRKGSQQPVAAGLSWLDRTSGATRDPLEPAHTLVELAKADRARANNAKWAAAVGERIDNARRWFGFVCAEGRSYRLTDGDGKALGCGDLRPWIDAALQAEVKAAITLRDWPRAVWSLDRSDWTLGKPTQRVVDELGAELARALPPRKSRFERLDVRALGAGSEPRMSPLSYSAKGELFAQTADGVVSIGAGGAAQPTDELDPWPLIILGPGERRITGLTLPCDRSEVTVAAQDPEGRFYDALGTSEFAPRPGACGGANTFFEPEVRVVSWTELEPDVFVGPLRRGHRTPLGTPGGPLSPDGRASVSVSRLGLFVTDAERAELWELPAPIDLGECVLSDGAKEVACLEGTRVVRVRPL
jgi:hypothetical protein